MRRAAWAVLIVATTITVLALGWTALASWVTPIGEYPSPQTVTAPGPFRPGDVVPVTAVKCMNRTYPVQGGSAFVQLAPTRRVVARPPVGVTVIKEKGCQTTDHENELPADLPAGVWRIEGASTAFIGIWRQDVSWYTEPFTVTRGNP